MNANIDLATTLYLITNTANLTDYIVGDDTNAAIANITLCNSITTGTHYFNNYDIALY